MSDFDDPFKDIRGLLANTALTNAAAEASRIIEEQTKLLTGPLVPELTGVRALMEDWELAPNRQLLAEVAEIKIPVMPDIVGALNSRDLGLSPVFEQLRESNSEVQQAIEAATAMRIEVAPIVEQFRNVIDSGLPQMHEFHRLARQVTSGLQLDTHAMMVDPDRIRRLVEQVPEWIETIEGDDDEEFDEVVLDKAVEDFNETAARITSSDRPEQALLAEVEQRLDEKGSSNAGQSKLTAASEAESRARGLVEAFLISLLSTLIVSAGIEFGAKPLLVKANKQEAKVSAKRQHCDHALEEGLTRFHESRVRMVCREMGVFALPEQSSTKLHMLELGEVVEVLEKRRNWTRVYWQPDETGFGAVEGWVFTRYLERLDFPERPYPEED